MNADGINYCIGAGLTGSHDYRGWQTRDHFIFEHGGQLWHSLFYDCSNCLSSPTHYCDNCFQRDFTFNYNFFWSSASDNASTTAFQASVIVLILIVVIIIPIEYWAQVGGFGLEDSEELEGLSTYVGINFTKIAIATAILSSLGAVAEAAIAIASGLDEIVSQHQAITSGQLFVDGTVIGKQIIGTAVNTLFFGFFLAVRWLCSFGSTGSIIHLGKF